MIKLEKIVVLQELKQDGLSISAIMRRTGMDRKTVRKLLDRGQIQRVPDRRRTAVRTVRSRRPWAKRQRSGLRPDAPGDGVQMDILTVTPKQGRPAIKQFTAIDSIAR